MNFFNFTIGAGSSASPNWLLAVFPGLTIALVAGITLFLLNWIREWLTAKWKRRADAEILAFTLVAELDRLLAACADVVDDPLYENYETGVWEVTVKAPTIEFPDSWNWSCFPTQLQYRIRSLPNKIHLANRLVSDIWRFGEGAPDYSDAFEERKFRYASIGLEAFHINNILVKDYGVPLLDRGEWDPEYHFRSDIEKIKKKREAWIARTSP